MKKNNISPTSSVPNSSNSSFPTQDNTSNTFEFLNNKSLNDDWRYITDDQVKYNIARIASKIEFERNRQNLNQVDLAGYTRISERTLKNAKRKNGLTEENLFKILLSLGIYNITLLPNSTEDEKTKILSIIQMIIDLAEELLTLLSK